MGRGRAKAKQVKVARDLKYNGGGFDPDRLRRELGVGTEARSADHDDPYAEFEAEDALDDDDGEEERRRGRLVAVALATHAATSARLAAPAERLVPVDTTATAEVKLRGRRSALSAGTFVTGSGGVSAQAVVTGSSTLFPRSLSGTGTG